MSNPVYDEVHELLMAKYFEKGYLQNGYSGQRDFAETMSKSVIRRISNESGIVQIFVLMNSADISNIVVHSSSAIKGTEYRRQANVDLNVLHDNKRLIGKPGCNWYMNRRFGRRIYASVEIDPNNLIDHLLDFSIGHFENKFGWSQEVKAKLYFDNEVVVQESGFGQTQMSFAISKRLERGERNHNAKRNPGTTYADKLYVFTACYSSESIDAVKQSLDF